MDKVSKNQKIEFGLLVMYLLNLFLPVYKQTFLGDTARVSVVGLNAGMFFLMLFFILIVGTIITSFVDEKVHRISYLVSVGFMTIFWLILFFFKESTSRMGISHFFQIVLVAELLLLYFKPSLAIRLFDSLVKILKVSLNWMLINIRKSFKYIQEKLSQKKDSDDTASSEEHKSDEEKEVIL